MNAFLRAVEAQRLADHESHVVNSRGRELYASPRDEEMGAMRANCSRGQHAKGAPASERDRAIIDATKAHPSYSPTAIARLVETTHTTVIRVQRREGLYRQPKQVGERWVTPPLVMP